MSTLSEVRAALRIVLGDSSAAGYLWSDGALNQAINDGIRSYSRACPRESTATVTTVVGTREYDLPAGCERVLRVEWVELGVDLLEGGNSEGAGFELFGGHLVVTPTPTVSGQTLALSYLGPHAAPSNDTDVSTVPAGDEDLLLAAAAALAVERLATDQRKARQFEDRGQTITSAVEGYRRRFADGLVARLKRVRTGRLVAG